MAPSDPDSTIAVAPWRKSTRAELIERRLAMEARERRALGERAKANLAANVDLRKWPVLGIYWPFRGEIDVRDIATRHLEDGGCVALPVVVVKSAPLEFRRWQPGMKMIRGVWNIPVPADENLVQPDALLVPLVGFERTGYRLGYGGGYYDRTLAASSPRPFCIGLGYERCGLATIHPQPHDIPMDLIVTDESVYRRAEQGSA
jgi:5-formyltetrahydrofolate cyclo-ligase